MTKLWSTNFLVAIGLLGFLTWTDVEAQKKNYQQQYGQNPQSYDSTSSHTGAYKSPPRPHGSLNCEVEPGLRVPCGNPDITFHRCSEIGCCHDGAQCYFGRTSTVHCTRDGYFIVVVARCDTQPSIDMDALSVLGQGDGCTAEASNSLFSVFRFPVSTCGTLVADEAGAIVYENVLTSTYRTQSSSGSVITRDTFYQLTFQCRYVTTATGYVNLELGIQDAPLSIYQEGPLNIVLKLANGECHQKGCSDQAYYTSFYTEDEYPIKKVLRDPVYVQVEVLNRNDPRAVLLLHHCWATKGPYPHSTPQWDILINGCPNSGDYQNIKLVPNDLDTYPHYKRFMFRMFAFVAQSSQKTTTSAQQVYIHCSTSICLTGGGNTCEQPCPHFNQKRKRAILDQQQKAIVTSSGLLYGDFQE